MTDFYTYSRARDHANDNQLLSTPADVERRWGSGNFDRTHVYAGSFVWTLPWFKDSDAGALRYLLGDRQASGILTLQSGHVLDVTANAASLNAPGNTQRPNLNGEVNYVGECQMRFSARFMF